MAVKYKGKKREVRGPSSLLPLTSYFLPLTQPSTYRIAIAAEGLTNWRWPRSSSTCSAAFLPAINA
jgi:hypothetical protein